MDFEEVPLIVVASKGDDSIDWLQPRDSIAPDLSAALEHSAVGEVKTWYQDVEILVIDPLRRNQ
jgi:hypothetical protein